MISDPPRGPEGEDTGIAQEGRITSPPGAEAAGERDSEEQVPRPELVRAAREQMPCPHQEPNGPASVPRAVERALADIGHTHTIEVEGTRSSIREVRALDDGAVEVSSVCSYRVRLAGLREIVQECCPPTNRVIGVDLRVLSTVRVGDEGQVQSMDEQVEVTRQWETPERRRAQ